MIKIKLTTHNYSPEIREEFLRQTPGGSGKWGDLQFFFNEPVSECDYWIIIDSIPKKESVLCPKNNIIFITCEPTAIKKYERKFLNQFSKVITTQPDVQHPHVYHMPSGHGWWPKKSFDELYGHNEVEKSKLISIVVSNRSQTEGHKKRLAFCKNLKNYFGDKIDIFGRGTQPFDDKWDVLAPYKYSVAIENSVEQDYISEKLTDNFVCLTFPFYYGCPNVGDYYDKNSYQLIDIDDFKKSCSMIEKIIRDQNHYNEHLKHLIATKNKYLEERFITPLIANFIKKEYGNTAYNSKERVTLKPEKNFQKIKHAVIDIRRFLAKIKAKL